MTDSTLKSELAEIPAIDWETLLATDSAPYGLTDAGFLPKPYGRLLAEGLALSRDLFGDEIDLERGTVIRKLIELSALENARTYTMMAGIVDNLTIPTAMGAALSRLGQEVGLPRPFLNAEGKVTLALAVPLTDEMPAVTVPQGARMLTPGGHHISTKSSVIFDGSSPTLTVDVEGFHPGPEHNLDPALPMQKIDRWNPLDIKLEPLRAIAAGLGAGKTAENVVKIDHTSKLSGGEMRWQDDRYRQMLLRAPRSVWTVDAMQSAVADIPGVRQVKLVDLQGGLDIDMPIFGTFNFGNRVFGTERDLASPYYFTVLVAPSPAAIWDGPDGLAALVADTLEDLRPIGVFPDIREAAQVNVGIKAEIVVDGVPLPSGDRATINRSAAAVALKSRIIKRIQGYISGMGFGDTISPAKISWSIMNETGVADVRNLQLIRYPLPAYEADLSDRSTAGQVEVLDCGVSLKTEPDQIAVYIDDANDLKII